eukprot:5901759-Prymnesium_polylepis.1
MIRQPWNLVDDLVVDATSTDRSPPPVDVVSVSHDHTTCAVGLPQGRSQGGGHRRGRAAVDLNEGARVRPHATEESRHHGRGLSQTTQVVD